MPRSLTSLLVVAVLLRAHGTASAQKAMHATVTAIDAKQGTIAVKRGMEKVDKLLTLNLLRPDIPVTDAHGRALKVTDLRPTDRVHLMLAGEQDVTAIRQESDMLWGLVVRYDADRKELVGRFGPIDRTLALSPEVRYVVEGQPAAPEAFSPGRPFHVLYSPDHTRVVELRAGKGITQYHPYGRIRYETCLLMEADHARRRLKTIVMEDRFGPRDFEYDPWTSLQLTHGDTAIKNGSIADLRPYCKVTIFAETDTDRVLHVRASMPTLMRRKVTAVDHATRRLTLSDGEGGEELTVAGDVVVRAATAPSRFEEVRVGGLVTCCLNFEGREVIYIVILPLNQCA